VNDINTLCIPEERANFYLMRVRQVENEIASGHLAPILYFIILELWFADRILESVADLSTLFA
jgi:hypothetical protein